MFEAGSSFGSLGFVCFFLFKGASARMLTGTGMRSAHFMIGRDYCDICLELYFLDTMKPTFTNPLFFLTLLFAADC